MTCQPLRKIMIVHDSIFKFGETAGCRAPFRTPPRGGVRRGVPGHVCMSGDPLDGPDYGAGLQEGALILIII